MKPAARVALAGAAVLAVLVFAFRPRRETAPVPVDRVDAAPAPIDAAPALVEKAIEEAGPPGVARVPGKCGATFTNPHADLDDATLATAVLERFDPDAGRFEMKAPAVRSDDDPDAFGVIDCRGRRIDAHPSSRFLPGTVQIVRRRVPSSSHASDSGFAADVVAIVAVGVDLGLCENERGVIALLGLHEGRLEVDAMGDYRGGCAGTEAPLTTIDWGGTFAVLQDDNDGGEDAISGTHKKVWIRRGADLVAVGNVATSLTQSRGTGEEPEYKREMAATLEPTAEGLLVHETWTFVRSVYDAGSGDFYPQPGAKARTKKIERRYWVEGDALKREPARDPEP